MPPPLGTRRERHLRRPVLLGHTIKDDGKGEIVGVYLHLYPGDEIGHLAKTSAKAREENEKLARLSGNPHHGAPAAERESENRARRAGWEDRDLGRRKDLGG